VFLWRMVNEVFDGCWRMFCVLARSEQLNDLTIGWQSLNLPSRPGAALAPQARQAGDSGENLNYVALAPQARPSGEILKYSQPNYHTLGYQTSLPCLWR